MLMLTLQMRKLRIKEVRPDADQRAENQKDVQMQYKDGSRALSLHNPHHVYHDATTS